MFDRFTYRQRNYGLLGLFILMLMVGYKRSFVLSLNALNEIETQEQQKLATINSQNNIQTLEFEIAQLNKNIGRSDIEPDKVNQEILSEISDYAKNNQVNLERLEKTHDFKTVDFNIYSNLIAVEGSFNGILSLIHHMENHFEFARLTNVDLYKEKDFKNKKNKLYAKLLFQHYRQN